MKAALLLPAMLAFASAPSSRSLAQSTITGTVFDSATGETLVGASIAEEGSFNGTATDARGMFTLNTPSAYPVRIKISFVGYNELSLSVVDANPVRVALTSTSKPLEEVVITARRRKETAQEVPIAISVVGGKMIEDAGAFNVARLKEMVPSVQLYSSNPRNTTLNIRGMGSTFGLTNDGIDPGVGFYLDGVYFARPAVTALDFIDVERIEILRGPQGTLFGKNTTAGAFNVTSRKPTFTPGGTMELSYGNLGFVQAKASITGPLTKTLATRISFSGTQRNGTLENVRTQGRVNDMNNIGFRGQLLFQPNEDLSLNLTLDCSFQRPDGFAQVIAGVVRTQRAEYRQFGSIIADLDYRLPTMNAFDRKIDHDTPWRSGNDLGGAALNVDMKLGPGTLTSTTAWRFWKWDPSNDRDFTGLPVLTRSQAPSVHSNWSQEVRYAGTISPRLSGVIGVFTMGQELRSDPVHTEESGAAQWRFSQSSTSTLWQTPGLFEGYGIETRTKLTSLSAAVFAQADIRLWQHWHVLPGLRFNLDKKAVDFDRKTYGGLQTDDPALIALQRQVYSAQQFSATAEEDNVSGQLTLSYKAGKRLTVFGTWSTTYKPVGVNLGGLPTLNGAPMLELATIRPERVTHYEAGVKTTPTEHTTVNLVGHMTDIADYQTLVQTAQLGVNRGYLANAEEVTVMGVEADAAARFSESFASYLAVAWTEGTYSKFTNALVPLEETGGAASFKDISGGDLPGISRWAGSTGGEWSSKQWHLLGRDGVLFIAVDAYYRSGFSSSPSPSQHLNINGYALANARIGFRASTDASVFLWGRNLMDTNYYEQLLAAAGNAGHYAGVLGDPRTFGITFRQNF